MPIEKRRTEKQRTRVVLQGLNQFYSKIAIQRAAGQIQVVWDANQADNPEAPKMLQALLTSLNKSNAAKQKAATPNMPTDFGWEKTPEEIKAEEKLSKRTGQTETVAVRGQIVDTPVVNTPVVASVPAQPSSRGPIGSGVDTSKR